MKTKGFPLAVLSMLFALAPLASAQSPTATATAIYRPEAAVSESVTTGVPTYVSTLAVAKLFTHGASFTCIFTDRDRSIYLGCAHAYAGPDASQCRSMRR